MGSPKYVDPQSTIGHRIAVLLVDTESNSEVFNGLAAWHDEALWLDADPVHIPIDGEPARRIMAAADIPAEIRSAIGDAEYLAVVPFFTSEQRPDLVDAPHTHAWPEAQTIDPDR